LLRHLHHQADAWTGEVATGPKTINVTKPYEQQPMWHKKDGGLMVVTNTPGLRIEGQDWSELTLESFPSTAAVPKETRRSVFALKTAERTDIVQTTDGSGKLTVTISAATDGESRAWALRVHMEPGQKATSATVDGKAIATTSIVHIAPRANDDGAEFPFAAVDAPPPSNAGHIALLRLESAAEPRTIEITLA
jgi:alpha-glucosidase (family GH31 glycosyl hydrolase)